VGQQIDLLWTIIEHLRNAVVRIVLPRRFEIGKIVQAIGRIMTVQQGFNLWGVKFKPIYWFIFHSILGGGGGQAGGEI